MVEEIEWDDLVTSAQLRPVWRGTLIVADEPRMLMWWQAWQNVAGGQDIMHVGVTCIAGDTEKASYELAARMLTGILNMCWRAVGHELVLETSPLMERLLSNGVEGFTGKVIVRAHSGKQFDPLMVAIQETKDNIDVEKT